MSEDKTHYGIDCLKILATIFVIMLHVNGFVRDSTSLLNFSEQTNVIWHILQAIAYPAIHLFVMITAWFGIEKVSVKKSIINAWLQCFIVCVGGDSCSMLENTI